MNYNERSSLEGTHAFLSPSKYHWIRYSPEKLVETYAKSVAAAKGVELHAFAEQAIRLRQKLTSTSKTLNMYVNDAIGYRMTPEVLVYYSEFAYGTVDALSFRRGLLRIHDLKTGVTPAKMEQLLIYAALYCLDEKVRPDSIKYELRIYQNDEVLVANPTVEDVLPIMDTIVYFDKLIREYRAEEL